MQRSHYKVKCKYIYIGYTVMWMSFPAGSVFKSPKYKHNSICEDALLSVKAEPK